MQSIPPIAIKTWLHLSKTDSARSTLTGQGQPDTSLLEPQLDGDTKQIQEAYQQLFDSIKYHYSPAQSRAIEKLLRPKSDAGEPLTSKIVNKAIYDIDPFDARWHKLHVDRAELSPTTDIGQKLIKKFTVSLEQRFTELHATSNEQKLAICEATKEEIAKAVYISLEVKGKLDSLIEISIQSLKFAIKLKNLSIPWMSQMKDPATDAWRLSMDGRRQDGGMYSFEDELGYMAAALGGLNLMIDTLDQRLDAKLLCELHDAAVHKVKSRCLSKSDASIIANMGYGIPEDLPSNYRNHRRASFGMMQNDTITVEGYNEFQASSKREWSSVAPHSVCDYMLECKLPPSFVKKLYELRAFSYPQTMSYQQAKKVAKDIVANIDTYYKEFNAALAIADSKQRADAMTAAEQNLAGVMEKSELHPLFDRDEIQAAYKAKADEILKTYHIELAETVKIKPSAPKETAILRCIAKCCQDLFQHHVFFDGNTRTDVFLAMNKLLLQNNLCPVIMDNPNVIAMHSLDQIVELMRQGQDTFRSLCR